MSKPTPAERWFHMVCAPRAGRYRMLSAAVRVEHPDGPAPRRAGGTHVSHVPPRRHRRDDQQTGISERRGNIGFRKERQEAARAQAPGRRARRRGDAALPVRGVRRRGRRGIRVRVRHRRRHRRRRGQGQLGLQGLLGRAHPRERHRRGSGSYARALRDRSVMDRSRTGVDVSRASLPRAGRRPGRPAARRRWPCRNDRRSA